MTPIKIIIDKMILEPEVLDLERISARLEHHDIRLLVSNDIASDSGDRWLVKGYLLERCLAAECADTTLRYAMAGALRKLLEL